MCKRVWGEKLRLIFVHKSKTCHSSSVIVSDHFSDYVPEHHASLYHMGNADVPTVDDVCKFQSTNEVQSAQRQVCGVRFSVQTLIGCESF